MSLFLDIWRFDTILTAEAKYPINFTQPRTRFALSLHYNGRNSFLFVNAESFLFDQWWNNNINMSAKNVMLVKKIKFGILLHVVMKMENI